MACLAAGIGVGEEAEFRGLGLDVQGDALVVAEWRTRSEDLRSWVTSGFDAVTALQWSRCFGSPGEAAAWHQAGVSLETACPLSGRNLAGYQAEPGDVVGLCERVVAAGARVQVEQVARSLTALLMAGADVGAAGDALVRLARARALSQEHAYLAADLLRLDVSLHAACDLVIASRGEVEAGTLAAHWRHLPGVGAREVARWARTGAGPERARRLAQCGIGPHAYDEHRKLFELGKEAVVVRLEHGERIEDVLEAPPVAYACWLDRRRKRHRRRATRRAAARRDWAEFFGVPADVLPSGMGACTIGAKQALVAARMRVPRPVREWWEANGGAPERFGRH